MPLRNDTVFPCYKIFILNTVIYKLSIFCTDTDKKSILVRKSSGKLRINPKRVEDCRRIVSLLQGNSINMQPDCIFHLYLCVSAKCHEFNLFSVR